MTESAILTRNLEKRFGGKSAVRGLNLEITRGTVCGLIGPNGAGKTTTIRMLLGLCPPTSGDVRVLGLDPRQDSYRLKQRIGYVPEKHYIYDWMKVCQVLKFTGELYPRWDWTECNRVKDLLELPTDCKVKDLSRGELAKLALTIAIAHKPELLLLDEPTSGLDPVVRREFLNAIVQLIQKEGRTVLFSTHILSDVERVADKVVVLAKGRVIADDSLEGLRSRYTKASFLFTAPPSGEPKIPGVLRLEKGLREWVIIFHALKEEEVKAVAAQMGATDCLIQPLNLEDIFMELIRAADGGNAC